jgi:drug/metabolite transporter (DMT)-like permease
MDDAQESKEASLLPRLRAERLGRRRASGLLLLNVLAALYGSSTVAGKFASDVAPGLPASLSSLVRFSSALLVFLPALRNVFQGQTQNPALLKAGAELGGLLFAASILETCGDGGASSDAPLLFAFTVSTPHPNSKPTHL